MEHMNHSRVARHTLTEWQPDKLSLNIIGALLLSLSSSTSQNSGVRTHRLSNGLTIVGESLADKRAAAWTFLIPSGAATEPAALDGLTTVLESLSYRGATSADGTVRDSRALSDALDDLGIDRGGGTETEYTTFGGATLSDYLPEALTLYADIIRRPYFLHENFPDEEFEAERVLALQALESLEDNPARKMFVQLRRVHFPDNYGRSPLGTREGLQALTPGALRDDHAARFCPNGAILSLAGGIDFDDVVQRVENLFGDWSGQLPEAPLPRPVNTPRVHHIAQETSQQHIGVAYAGVPTTSEHFYNYRLAISVLSGGMGARLFTEVREKRGLVYSVSASATSLRGCGVTLAYAGTTPERSQETLDVLLGELRRMAEGVTEEEVERAKVGMLSELVMQEESSRSRASAIARDQFILGRVRTLDEVTEAINKVSPQTIAEFYEQNPARDFTVVTLGPRELQVNGS
jgi:predicted Zn-dependent peptidase